MRKSKDITPSIDITKPITLKDIPIDENDCFGFEWEPLNVDCSMCASHTLCGIVFAQNQLKKNKEIELKQGNFLDQVDSIKLNKKQIKEIDSYISDKIDNKVKFGIVEVFNFIKDIVKIRDNDMVKDIMAYYFRETDLFLYDEKLKKITRK